MVLASSTTSVLSTLLLVLMLLHQGLQASVRRSTTHHSSSATTSTLNCSLIIQEIKEKLSGATLTNGDYRSTLRSPTLRRANLHKFLEKHRKLDSKDDVGIRSNLQGLECCLPEAEGNSQNSNIIIGNLADLQEKLRFFLGTLPQLPNPRPASDCHVTHHGA